MNKELLPVGECTRRIDGFRAEVAVFLDAGSAGRRIRSVSRRGYRVLDADFIDGRVEERRCERFR